MKTLTPAQIAVMFLSCVPSSVVEYLDTLSGSYAAEAIFTEICNACENRTGYIISKRNGVVTMGNRKVLSKGASKSTRESAMLWISYLKASSVLVTETELLDSVIGNAVRRVKYAALCYMRVYSLRSEYSTNISNRANKIP